MWLIVFFVPPQPWEKSMHRGGGGGEGGGEPGTLSSLFIFFIWHNGFSFPHLQTTRSEAFQLKRWQALTHAPTPVCPCMNSAPPLREKRYCSPRSQCLDLCPERHEVAYSLSAPAIYILKCLNAVIIRFLNSLFAAMFFGQLPWLPVMRGKQTYPNG